MVADNKDKKKDSIKANQAEVLKTYEREGSDFLDVQSQQRRSTVDSHQF